ncbi:MAG: hypothetical protein CFE21_06705 [Bacteroidetes bacterium B1(2017)]|nr:MAG: hypothetical protein CFE21_06705 [Bacteroidetes bacterium B1(2017)]
MDELNKRVLSVMIQKNLSKSSFAQILEISLPVLTHIGSGRNKPGLELIQKILDKFPDISPDWLILGTGAMYREEKKNADLSIELKNLQEIALKIPDLAKNAAQIEEYHAILLREILYLKELAPYLSAVQNNSRALRSEIEKEIFSIESKLK